VVQRLHQLPGLELDDDAGAEADDDVVGDLAGVQLRDRLVRRVVRPDLDLAVELLAELLDQRRVDVVGVVEDLQRPALGR
jgi:hypothetical protein